MEGLGLIILLGFIVAVIITAVERWRYKEFGINTDNDRTGKKAAVFGWSLGLLLAILVAMALNGSKDSQAVYYINGVVTKGGTNWMIVVVTFLIGGGIIFLLIQLFSALPILFMRSISKEYRQKLRELRASGTLPIVYRKKFFAILIAVITFGIGYWFYMRMWKIGYLHLLSLIVGIIFGNWGVSVVTQVLVWSMWALTAGNLIIAFRKKEVKLNDCTVHLL